MLFDGQKREGEVEGEGGQQPNKSILKSGIWKGRIHFLEWESVPEFNLIFMDNGSIHGIMDGQ